MKSNIVKENHIGSVVSGPFGTNRQTDIILFFYKDLIAYYLQDESKRFNLNAFKVLGKARKPLWSRWKIINFKSNNKLSAKPLVPSGSVFE